MRATGVMLVPGLGLAITENLAASEAEEFNPLEDERMSGRSERRNTDEPCAEERLDLVAAFSDGKGTVDVLRRARSPGPEVIEFATTCRPGTGSALPAGAAFIGSARSGLLVSVRDLPEFR